MANGKEEKMAGEIQVGTYLYDTLNSHLGSAAGGRVTEVRRTDYGVIYTVALDSEHCPKTWADQSDVESGRWEVRDNEEVVA